MDSIDVIAAENLFQKIKGLSLDEAQVALKDDNVSLRVTKINGTEQMRTMDFRPRRMNVEVDDNDIIISFVNMG